MSNTRKFALITTFLTILLPLALASLGFITLGSLNPTTTHIPVIIGSVVLESKIGGMLSDTFGITNLTKSATAPTPLPSIFSPLIPVISISHDSWKALLIVPIPRTSIGVVPYFAYKWLNKLTREKVQPVSLFMAGVLSSVANTILVMSMIYFLFNSVYVKIIDRAGTAAYLVITATVFSSDVPETLVVGIAAPTTVSILLRLMKRNAT